MNYLKNVIDRSTNSSSIRFCLVFSSLFVTVVPLTTWLIVSIRNSKIEDMPSGIVTFGLGILGIIISGKSFEKVQEIKKCGQ